MFFEEDDMKRVYRITGISEELARKTFERFNLSKETLDAIIGIWPRNSDGSYKPLLGGPEVEAFYAEVTTLIFTDSASEH